MKSFFKVSYFFDCGIIRGMLDKLEKKIGRYAVKNLIYYLLGGYVIGYVLYFMYAYSLNNWYAYIVLDPALVMKGQVWRLFTWILTVPQGISIWLIFMFMLYYFIGKSLEATIGTFRYNVYIFSGWFFMTLGAMIVYWVSTAIVGAENAISIDVSTYYINMASFLAFAVLYPQYKVYLFGIIPLKMKWLAIFDVVYLGFEIIGYSLMFTDIGAEVLMETYGYTTEYVAAYRLLAAAEIFCILVSLLNFIIFWFANRSIRAKNLKRQAQFKRSYNAGARQQGAYYSNSRNSSASAQKKSYRPPSGTGQIVHRCAICGRTSTEYPELTFRYCSKCAGNHEYCEDHLFTHEHVK